MLNISNNNINKYVPQEKYSTLNSVENKKSSKVLRKIIYVSFALFIVILILPWTQNVRSDGYVTTLRPDQKPQSLNSTISGKVEMWYVQEGDYVHEGDTILRISEIKDNYMDENLLRRTQDQVDLKKASVETYSDKVVIQETQMTVLKNQRDLKLSQAKNKLVQAINKVQNDSINYITAKLNYKTATYQYERMDSLYSLGLKSLTDLEKRRVKQQETESYIIAAKNKWLNSQNDLINLQLDITNVNVDYQTKLNKLQSDRFSTISQKLDTETSVSKLENQYSNYLFRQGLYFVTAPQSGYITKTTVNGIGKIIKEGEEILTLMPVDYDLAVEIYIDPIDLPLIKIGEKVRLQFDGWPAIVFSGWPNASQGTYGGEIYAIDQFISANGKYRMLVSPDPEDSPWPDALRFGGGTSTLILLNDVPIWYELWRNINGFPPDYYGTRIQKKATKKK